MVCLHRVLKKKKTDSDMKAMATGQKLWHIPFGDNDYELLQCLQCKDSCHEDTTLEKLRKFTVPSIQISVYNGEKE